MKAEEITAEEFTREKIREKQEIIGEMLALCKYQISGEDCLRWAHEYANLKTQQIEADKMELLTELKEAMLVLKERNRTANELMDHCVDTGFIDYEDETDGLMSFKESNTMVHDSLKSINKLIQKHTATTTDNKNPN